VSGALQVPTRSVPARGPAPRSGRRRWPPAWTLTAALASAYLLIAPASPDLAAASYRSYLFSQHGLSLWDNSWYGGHDLLAYSVLAPPLGALVPPRLLAAIAMTAATALFAALIEGRFPRRATRIAAAWFALGAGVALLSSRVPFDLALPIALGALLAARRGRSPTALALAVASSLASPVAGAFLALAAIVWALAGGARRLGLGIALAALAPIAALALAFPEGGSQPFVASAFYPALAGVLAIGVLIEPRERLLRTGAALYALALCASYLLPTAVGGNADRLGALAAGPIAACALAGLPLRGWRARALLVLAPALLYWQLNAPLADFVAAETTPATAASYYAPLLGELRTLGIGYGARPARIEVVPTAAHWEARWVAPRVALARGWERQLDTQRNALFYSAAPLTPARYLAWLRARSISYVALPDAPLDYSGRAEARLLRSPQRPGALRELWRSAHWRLFALRGAVPLAAAPGVLTELGTQDFTLLAPRAGRYEVHVRYSSYWALRGARGCVRRAPGDWTAVQAPAPGSYHVVVAFSLARAFARGPRCS
jgi:hypothetical protein